MRGVEAEVDKEGDGHSILEPLHHVGLTVEGVGHVASQDDDVARARRHKLGLVLHSAGGTWGEGMGFLCQNRWGLLLILTAARVLGSFTSNASLPTGINEPAAHPLPAPFEHHRLPSLLI